MSLINPTGLHRCATGDLGIYKNWIDIPDTAVHMDFVKSRYAANGEPKGFEEVGNFTRLSKATMWQDGQLVEVANSVPRISGEGLLIEPQRTNSWPSSETFDTNNMRPLGDLIRYSTTEIGIRGKRQARGYQINPDVGGQGGWLATPSTTSGNTRSIYARAPSIDKEGSLGLLVQNTSSDSELFTITMEWYRFSMETTHRQLHPVDFRKTGTTTDTVIIQGLQREEGKITSYIPTDGAPVTRAPDILKVPLLETQTLTGDWDEDVTYETVDGEAVFTGHGYIRTIEVNDGVEA